MSRFNIKGLLLILFLSFTLSFQLCFLAPIVGKDLAKIRNNFGQTMIWRSANYAQNQKFAHYINFLLEHIPEKSKVLIPPSSTLPKILSHSLYMSFFLFPREIVNCSDLSTVCVENFANADTYVLVNGDYPPKTVLNQAQRLVMFDESWGVYLPKKAPIETTVSVKHFGSLLEMAQQAILPLTWLLLLIMSGMVFVHYLVPHWGWVLKAGLGYGVSLSLLSLGMGLLSMLNVPLSSLVILLLTLSFFMVALLILFFKHSCTNDQQNSHFNTRIDMAWTLFFVILASITSVIGVGKSYYVTDEIILWGLLGYKTAAYQSIHFGYLWNDLYPFHIPLLISAIKVLFNDSLPSAKFVFSGYYLSLMLVMLGFFRQQKIPAFYSGLAVLTVGTTPLLFTHATLSYANLPFTFYLVAATLTLTYTIDKDSDSTGWRAYLLAGILFCAAAWTRPEGQIFAWILVIFLMIILLVFKRQWFNARGFIVIGICFIVYLVFWNFFKDSISTHILSHLNMLTPTITKLMKGDFQWYIIQTIMEYFIRLSLHFSSWGGGGIVVWASLPIGLLLWKKKGWTMGLITLISGWLFLLGLLMSYYPLSVFFKESHDISFWLAVGLDRMLMPALVLIWWGFVAALFSENLEPC